MYDPTRPGPFYEDFRVGATLPPLPSVTLTDADNAMYRAVTGDQHLLAADAGRYRAASGSGGALANPGIVMHYSIGQTTMATRQAIANLYYRSVRVLRPVELGQTLTTVTTVLGLKDSAPKGDQFRGKVWLGIVTSSEDGPVVEYERCALVRGNGPAQPGHDDDIPGPSDPTPLADLVAGVPAWDLAGLPAGVVGGRRRARRPAPRPRRPRRAVRPPHVQPGSGAPRRHDDRQRPPPRLRRPRAGPRPGVAARACCRASPRSRRGTAATTSARRTRAT